VLADWNGTLVLYSHGYIAPGSTNPAGTWPTPDRALPTAFPTPPMSLGTRRLPDFSPPLAVTLLGHPSPLYGWKVTRQDRAVWPRTAGGPRPVFRPRHRERADGFEGSVARASERPEAGTEPRAERHEA
jgi:hypothetical protein